MNLDNVGYSIGENGTGTEGATNNWILIPSGAAVILGTDYPIILTNAAVDIITSEDILVDLGDGGAGDGDKNSFIIYWELGTHKNITPGTQIATEMSPTSIMQNSITPDRYATNVYLTLEAH